HFPSRSLRSPTRAPVSETGAFFDSLSSGGHRTGWQAAALVQWSWRPFWGCRRYDKSRPVASLRRVGALTYRSKRASNGIQVDQGVARKAKQKPEGEMEGTKTTA